jgi:hypothetical protein
MHDPNWLKEPDPSGEPVVYVSIPEHAKLTPEITEALNVLSKALQELGEQTPHTKTKPCGDLTFCSPLDICQTYSSKQCFVLSSCRIRL